MIILEVIFAILLFIAVLLILLLVWPVRIDGRTAFEFTEIRFKIRVKLFSGAIQLVCSDPECILLCVGPIKISLNVQKKQKTKTIVKAKTEPGKFEQLSTWIERARVVKENKTEILKLLKHIHFTESRFNIAYGFLNPAATGIVYGLILPLTELLPESSSIHQSPDFTGLHLDGRYSFKIKFQIILLILPAIKIVFHMRDEFRKLKNTQVSEEI